MIDRFHFVGSDINTTWSNVRGPIKKREWSFVFYHSCCPHVLSKRESERKVTWKTPRKVTFESLSKIRNRCYRR